MERRRIIETRKVSIMRDVPTGLNFLDKNAFCVDAYKNYLNIFIMLKRPSKIKFDWKTHHVTARMATLK